jgi:signal peptidase I
MQDILLIAYVALLLAAAVVTLLKGKWGMLVAGVAFGFAWVVAALRLAKPGSMWSRWFYDRDKRQRAREVEPFRRRLATAGGLIAVLGVVAIFGLLKAYRIPTAAMEPTLRCAGVGVGCTAEDSDRLVAVRYLFRQEPKRGDIVAFEIPRRGALDCGGRPGSIYIKRVIGLPGERWALRRGVVHIDGEPLREPYVPDDRRDTGSRLPQLIPDGQYIVLGDNRAHSCDSRVWGLLPRDRLIGRAAFRYWPVDRIGAP